MAAARRTLRLADLVDQPLQLCVPHKRVDATIQTALRQLTGTHLFQPKLDGIRCLAVVDLTTVALRSRNGEDITPIYPEVASKLSRLDIRAVLDGELVHYGPDGRPAFTAMSWRNSQRNTSMIARSAATMPVSLVVFDTLWLGDRDLRQRPLADRLEALDSLPLTGSIQHCPTTADGLTLWDQVSALQLEGVVAKLASSRYTGRRSMDWIKVKQVHHASVIVGNVLASDRRPVGKVEVHVLDGDRLVSLGEVGTGWSERELADLAWRVKCYAADPVGRDPVVIDVAFAGLYPDGRLKFAAFRGIRTDITWTTCTSDQEGLCPAARDPRHHP